MSSRRLPMIGTVVLAFFLCVLVAIGPPARSGAPLSDQERQVVEKAISKVKPALVRILVAEVDYSQGREVKSESGGSGVIISKDGYVVTNHHVAGWAKRIVCTLTSKEEVDADLVGTDALMDIAVLKLRNSGGREFPTAAWGSSSKLNVGDRVLAMGSPLALSQSVTMGIVSNTEMIMPDMFSWYQLTLDGEDVGSMVRWIGHDAMIFPGNSGGPLVNLNGEIIGINEISMGLSGAIPSELARPVAEEIIKSGKVRRAWLGMSCQPVLKGSKLDRGVLIGGVISDSPADKAGFKAGDVMVRLNGNDVFVRFPEQVPLCNQSIAALPPGQEVDAVVLRDGKEVALKVTPQERPEARYKPHEFKQWGLCGSNISLMAARALKRPNQDGVYVCSVRPGGPSEDAKPGITSDDVITEVGGRSVKTVADLMTITDEIMKGKTEPTPVLVTFERKSEKFITVVKVGTRKFEDPGREVRKAYLPIAMQVITRDIAEALGIEERTGVRVTQVYPETSAEKAGIMVGDLLVEIDGEEIPASQPEDSEVLPAIIRQYKVGSTVDFTVIRGSEEIKIPVLLEESRPLPREMKKYRDENFEFTCRDIAFSDRTREKVEKEVAGVYVEEVSDGGWAALAGLSSGDIVSAVDGRPVPDVSVLREVMEKVGEDKPRHVVLRIKRGIQELFVELEPDWSDGKG